MGYIRKRWYKLDLEKLLNRYNTVYGAEKEMMLPRNTIDVLKKRKISEDNRYFDKLKSYLMPVFGSENE